MYTLIGFASCAMWRQGLPLTSALTVLKLAILAITSLAVMV